MDSHSVSHYVGCTVTPPLEPPVITFIPAEGTEDSAAVLVTVSGRILNNNTDTQLVFIIRNAPPEITFNTGKKYNAGSHLHCWLNILSEMEVRNILPEIALDTGERQTAWSYLQYN